MSTLDILLLILIIGALGLAVRRVIRSKRQGKVCNGKCEGCAGCGAARR